MKNSLSAYLVSGASGFIGTDFITYLSKRNFTYEVFQRIDWHLQKLTSTSNFEIGFFETEVLNLFLDKTHFVHLATKYEKPGLETDPAGILEANVTYSYLCLRLARHFNMHFTSMSSIQQYSGVPGIYSQSKKLFDSILDHEVSSNLKSSRLIIGDTFGVNDNRHKLISYLLNETLSGRSIELSHPKNRYAPIEVLDVSDRLFECSQKEGIFKLIPEESIDLESLVEMCEEITNRQISVNWMSNRSKPYDWENAPGEAILSSKNLSRLPYYIATEWAKKCSLLE